MGPWLKKFFTDETAFVRISRALILGVGAGGAHFADDLAGNVSPGAVKAVKIGGIVLAMLAVSLGAGDKNPEPKP